MEATSIRAKAGIKTRYACCTLPLRNGIKNAPKMKNMAGGNHSIIVIFFLHESALLSQKFGKHNNQNTRDKSIQSSPSGYLIPEKYGMISTRNQKICQDNYCKSYIKEPSEPPCIVRITEIKYNLFYHLITSFARVRK